MYLEVNEPIEVWPRFGVGRPRIERLFFRWKDRLFEVQDVTFYHMEWRGEALVHHLAVTAAVVQGRIRPSRNGRPVRRGVSPAALRVFELGFNSKSLVWVLEKYYEPE